MFTAVYILILRLKIYIVSSVTYLEPDKCKDHLLGGVKAPLHALSVLEKAPAQGVSALNYGSEGHQRGWMSCARIRWGDPSCPLGPCYLPVQACENPGVQWVVPLLESPLGLTLRNWPFVMFDTGAISESTALAHSGVITSKLVLCTASEGGHTDDNNASWFFSLL